MLPLALISMIAGVAGGLARFGLHINIPESAAHHGALMSGSFLGTVILLERVIVLKRRIYLLLPLLNLLSLPLFLAGEPKLATLALICGGAGMLVTFLIIAMRFPSIEAIVMLAGAAFYLIGNFVLYLTGSYPRTFPHWFGFFLFIITGERLELTRYLNISRNAKTLLLLLLSLTALSLFLPFHYTGRWLVAACLTAVAFWLLRYDMAGISMKKSGQFRYNGLTLFSGYIWLALTGPVMVVFHHAPFGYDAVLHMFFLGFVFSMIMAHAPVILPAVTGLRTRPWHTSLHFWIPLFHLGLTGRIAGDLLPLIPLRQYSGLLLAAVMVGFFVHMGVLLVKGRG
jgi:hypothetical protein